MRRSFPKAMTWTLVTLLAMAAAMRPAIAGVGPLLPVIGDDLQLDGAQLALLGSIPVIGFGVGAFITPRLAERFDNMALLRTVMLLLGLAMLWRSFGSSLAMFSATVAIGLVLAVGNTILPSVVRADFPEHIGLATGLYTTVMAGFASVASWLAVPLAGSDGTDWQRSLALPAILTVVALAFSFIPSPAKSVHSAHPPQLAKVLRNRHAWTVTIYMGLQSASFYAIITWLPSFLQAYGASPIEAGAWLSYVGLIGIPLGLALPLITSRVSTLAPAAVACSALAAAGLIGLAAAPGSLTWLWLTIMGLGQGLAFPIGLSLVAARTKHPATTTALSAMAQGGGYLIAAIGTYLMGWIQDVSGSWQLAMVSLAAFAIGQSVVAGLAGSDRPIE